MFGRPNGRKTLGEVLWTGKKFVAIVQLETRGRFPAGDRWRVRADLVRLATDEEKSREIGIHGRRPIVTSANNYAVGKAR